MEDCLQQGLKQVAAGYIIYGSSTIFVYTSGNGVHGFTLDPSFGEFILSHPDIKTPKKSKIYSINEGNYLYWHPGLKNILNGCKKKTKQLIDRIHHATSAQWFLIFIEIFYTAVYICTLLIQETQMVS